MKFHKRINPDVIAVAGTWDPLLPRHIALFKNLLRHAHKKGLNPYVFMFYPTPANYLHQNHYKDYFDLEARIAIFKRLGINNIIVLDFNQEDLRRGTGEFFDELAKNTGITIAEFWVGENQSLGIAPQGLLSIGPECATRKIKLRTLKNSFLVNLDKDAVYRNFNQGNFEATAAIIGYFPTYKLKDDLQVNMHDGVYAAKLRVNPFESHGELTVTITIMNGHADSVERPAGFDWLILSGRIEQT
ncbi:MAG TPA: hypothetical protein VFE53_15640 [Mucilaginibacter sp.]|jgi:FAD synthase|nr:hypothetical protein [Mucilaginibacter sp.]